MFILRCRTGINTPKKQTQGPEVLLMTINTEVSGLTGDSQLCSWEAAAQATGRAANPIPCRQEEKMGLVSLAMLQMQKVSQRQRCSDKRTDLLNLLIKSLEEKKREKKKKDATKSSFWNPSQALARSCHKFQDYWLQNPLRMPESWLCSLPHACRNLLP